MSQVLRLFVAFSSVAVIAIIAVVIATDGSPAGGISFAPGGDDAAERQVDPDTAPQVGPIDSLEAFTAQYGDAPNSDYARLRIPSIGVDAPVGLFIVDGNQMPDPQGPADVAFYDMSHWDGMGGYPGQGGNAIFAGHVDLDRPVPYAGGARYRGPAVFWHLDSLRPGDIVEVGHGGETLRYAVTWVEDMDTSGTRWNQIWSDDVDVDSITLFTCGGTFDFETSSYSHRLVVRAERV